MKLRNKKTGEIADGFVQVVIQNNNKFPNPLEYYTMTTIAELNEEWEDYKPTEPLIKDEKVRKAVRAWADFNGVKEVAYFKEDFGLRLAYHTISIDLYVDIDELENYKHYTIAELCGEEE